MKKKAAIRRISPPPSDEELAAAERTENARMQSRIEAIEDEKEQTRLAAAGDPDAVAALESLRAGASVLSGRPAIDDKEEPPPLKPKASRKSKSARRREKPVDVELPLLDDDDDRAAALFEKNAFHLMDVAFKKWRKNSEKNPREAFRALARDLGGDSALYIKAGILRMSDILDSMVKLTAMGKPKEEVEAGAEDFDSEMESFRDALRGGK